MGGLNTSMSIAVQALMAEQGALNVTTNNIANVNTPGYSREVAQFDESPLTEENGLTSGGGVTLEQFQSVRDELLQLQIYAETQQQSSSQTQVNSLTQIENNFSDPTQGVGGALSSFFSSLSQLSTDPTDSSARQQVLASANNLVTSFHQAVTSLDSIQSGLDQSVPQTVSQINQLTAQIATLNGQVAQAQGAGQDPGTIEDQRDQLITQLSGLVNVNVTQTNDGLTLTTGNGVPLVVAGQSFALQSGTGASGEQDVFSQGQDITSQITGGSLAGTIQVRDQVIPSLLNQLDTLANQFATAFNTQQEAGFDLSGKAGQAFFTVPASVAGSAAGIGVAITDPSLIAASSDGSAGSNGNLAKLLALQNAALPSGSSPTEMYSNLVLQVGNDASNATADANTGTSSLQQLTDQRGAISGVSLDEETTNMLQYQKAYQAAAEVVTTVNSMMQTLLNMGTSGGVA